MRRSECMRAHLRADQRTVNGESQKPHSQEPTSHSQDARQRTLGDFVIERELGRGGMGVVWLATQKLLGRRVALKTLPDFATMDPAAVLRFRREAEATSRIAHPGVVPVYGTGDVDGIHWYAMEFVDGPTLASWIERISSRQSERLDASLVDEVEQGQRYPSLREPKAASGGNRYVRSCARLCADVASALSAAHRAGVVHRDVKPGNVMIHPSGRPVVVDFGLARDEQSAQLTRSGEQLGTPSYMAPEQARGSRGIDARADVYGLGAVLYELLALEPPFRGGSAAEIAARILSEEPAFVQKRNPNVPPALAAIVHRCLQKEPDARYPAMEALEADLRAFLAGERIAAKLPSTFARAHAFVQRRRNALLASAAASAAAVAIAVFAGVVDDRGDVREGERALREARAALVEGGDPDRARDLYERAAALTKQREKVGEQRRRDFAEAFESLYAKDGGMAALRRFSAVFDDREKKELATMLERLDGRGAIRFASRVEELRAATLDVRTVKDGAFTGDWAPLRAGEPMPVGEHLVRAVREDGCTTQARMLVRNDITERFEPGWIEARDVPDGFVPAVDAEDGGRMVVSAFETSRAEWRRWLRSLSPTLAAEMTPSVWSEDERDDALPVRGLSFHQARSFVNAHGAHLPTRREQWLAASGGLTQLTWPWGGAFDAARIVADPFTRNEAMPARSLADGQSPLGVRHSLGNVAEVLAAERRALFVGGGSFADDAKALVLDGSNASLAVAPLTSSFEASPTAGVRAFRFIAAPEDSARSLEMRRQREELERSSQSCVFHDWELREDGSMSCELMLLGVHDGGARERSFAFDTPGFAQLRGSLRAVDGHGRDLEIVGAATPGGERATIRTELPQGLRSGQGYRHRVRATLLPVAGLAPERDAFCLRLPMERGFAVAQMHTLTLPVGSRVESVSPEAETWTEKGRVHVAWRQTADARIEAATVRFRRDGGLGSVPSIVEAERRCANLFAAWTSRSAELAQLLDEDFVHEPHGTGRADALRRATAGDGGSFATPTIEDVVRVGSIESCEVRVDWTLRGEDGSPFVWKAAPFLVQWREEAGVMRALRMQPFPQADEGRYVDDGYRNDGLRAHVARSAGATLARTQDALCPLQVEIRAGARIALITGMLAAPGESEDVVRFRLSGGDVLQGSPLAREEGGVEIRECFRDGKVVRESWMFLQRGSRRFLVRSGSAADDASESQKWLREAVGLLRID